MNLSNLDIGIVIGYLIITIVIGFYISKSASKNLRSYFLADNKISWQLLGLSNASGMFDISGTMWMVTLLFVYGLKSAWIPWLWPVWNQVFIMIFLAIWLRRSNVITGAQWITHRFGDQRGGRLAHIIVTIFAVISVFGFIAYFFVGIGKFATIFFPWDLSVEGLIPLTSEHVYALIIMGITTLYVIKGGIYSVVLTEVLQFIIMSISCVVVAYIAMTSVSAEQVLNAVPKGWSDLSFGWNLDLDWSNHLAAVNTKINNDGFELFGYLFMMMLFKGIFASLAGPVPSYDMQRVLSTRTPVEAAKMSGLSILALLFPRYLMITGFAVLAYLFMMMLFKGIFASLAGPVPSYDMQRVLSTKTPVEAAKMSGLSILALLFPRYLMITGFAVLALVYLLPDFQAMGTELDFELILPMAIEKFIPIGFKGLLLAGLLAAFMSTFAAFVNAAPAYLVNDLYKKYVNPTATDKTYVRFSYLASLIIVGIGLIAGFFAESINSLTLWITSALYGGYAAANVLKWIWWRFNGYGYFYGMLAGLVASTFVPPLMPEVAAIYIFPIILVASFVGCILGTFLTRPNEDEVLMNFYTQTKPWGFWKPVIRKIQLQNPSFEPNKDFKRDSINVCIGIIWQMSLTVMPIYLVIKNFNLFAVGASVFIITSILLKLNWYDKLVE